MRALFATLERYAASPFSALITGETGTGKGEVARTLHRLSGRTGPFVLLDCATVPRELAASLLLGHAKGAFTGAREATPSPFERAQGGTLFLDEVGELPLELQQILLTVLGSGTVQRVGESVERPIDARVVAATNRDLRAEVAEGRFREDLFYRLAEFPIWVPPLRDRPGDALHLASVFLERFAREVGRPLVRMDASAELEIARQPWRGNVRELRNAVRWAAWGCEGVIQRKDLLRPPGEKPPSLRAPASERSDSETLELAEGLKAAVEKFEREWIEAALEACERNVTRAAELARMSRSAFAEKLHKLSIRRKR